MGSFFFFFSVYHILSIPGERFSLISRVAATHGGPYRDEELGGISLPAEMDRLGHSKRYFVGKIRPGKEKANEFDGKSIQMGIVEHLTLSYFYTSTDEEQ